jgi:hypothetical protein
MLKSYKSRFKAIWDDSQTMKSGIIKRIGQGDVDALKQEQHNPKVIEATKERLK